MVRCAVLDGQVCLSRMVSAAAAGFTWEDDITVLAWEGVSLQAAAAEERGGVVFRGSQQLVLGKLNLLRESASGKRTK
ncbi:hypothetical protein FQA47_014112 [Oryzias melastigma]|uniref:Uncharacterized protein n=1 Tax=Oryzias melastigma TaxID=30732 RepID=A0A834KUQ4_ORYME|nr:hypothetical protein FQA47_014112 [Oryzias melastigma]